MKKGVIWLIIGLIVLGIIFGGYYFLNQEGRINFKTPSEGEIINTENLQNILDQISQSINNINQNLENAENK